MLEYMTTIPSIHSYNIKYSQHIQHVAVIFSNYNCSKHLECILTARIHYHYILSTHLEYIVTTLSVQSYNTWTLQFQYKTRIHRHCTQSTQL